MYKTENTLGNLTNINIHLLLDVIKFKKIYGPI